MVQFNGHRQEGFPMQAHILLSRYDGTFIYIYIYLPIDVWQNCEG